MTEPLSQKRRVVVYFYDRNDMPAQDAPQFHEPVIVDYSTGRTDTTPREERGWAIQAALKRLGEVAMEFGFLGGGTQDDAPHVDREESKGASGRAQEGDQ
jgi:hypothetical protein